MQSTPGTEATTGPESTGTESTRTEITSTEITRTESTENRRRRVPAMAPEERRAALIAATIPLLHEHGLDVSTRQIAHAAGVAEGTIFGVFESKSQLVVCSVIKALDPQYTLDALAAIDPATDLRDRVARTAELIHARFTEHAHLMSAARKLILSPPEPGTGKPAGHDQDAHQRMMSSRQKLHAAVAEIFVPDAARLRVSPDRAARILLLHCGADAFGPFGEPGTFHGEDLAALLLDGILTSDDTRTILTGDSPASSDTHTHTDTHTHNTETDRGDQTPC
ncbi:TetR/AcrR family transcriptional regulator [Actinoplanes missouriensis]|nr:TetR/AcrR family transcriptional regulator [Actinoplanes missouriensis]